MQPEREAAEEPSASSNTGGDGRSCCGGGGRRLSWSFATHIGMRDVMEDRVTICPNFMSISCPEVGGCASPESHAAGEDSPVYYFAVFDGHGGSQVSNYCASRLHEIVAYEWNRGTDDEVCGWNKKWELVLSRAFAKADDAFKDGMLAPHSVGSTALVVVVSACQIIASNCGDSRALICRGDEIVPLTKDHKPSRDDEVERIMNSGGRILYWQGTRVEGILSVTRSIGDQFLKPWITSDPELTYATRCKEDECLILASDGLWDVLSNKQIGKLAVTLIKKKREEAAGCSSSLTKSVASSLLKLARKKGSKDNISVIVVDLKPLAT